MSPEGGFWFITFSDVDEVVSVLEIDLGIHMGFLWSIQQISDKQKWVAVFLHDSVETTEVNT